MRSDNASFMLKDWLSCASNQIINKRFLCFPAQYITIILPYTAVRIIKQLTIQKLH